MEIRIAWLICKLKYHIMSIQLNDQTVKFGVAQLQNEVPTVIKYIYRTILFLSGIYALISTSLHIPDTVNVEVLKIISLSDSILYFTCQFFGIQPPDGAKPTN